jgi:hypothetical protein
MHFAKLAGTALLLSLVVDAGYAAELIPIELTAISQTMTVSRGGEGGLEDSNTGTSDVVLQWTQDAELEGSGTSSASVIDGRLILRFEGSLSTASSSNHGSGSTCVHVIEFDVPNLGDATTAVFLRVRMLSSDGPLANERIDINMGEEYESAILAEPVAIFIPPVLISFGGGGAVTSITAIAGDRIRTQIRSNASHSISGPGSGSYDETFVLDFFAVQPTTPEPTTECSDGIDNDADGRIDLEDKQCKSAEQQSESDPKL